MPSVFHKGSYRFFFYSSDRDESPYIHVERDGYRAKFWLDPIRLQSNRGFSQSEIDRIEKLLAETGERFLSRWNDFFVD